MQIWKKEFTLNTDICLQPTILPYTEFIRVFAGHLDYKRMVGYTGYFDLVLEDRQIINEKRFVLEPGPPGMFDSYGAVPTWAMREEDNQVYLYYAGYQQLKDLRFCIFGGLAVSKNDGPFKRYANIPVMDRTPSESLFRVPHCVLKDKNRFGKIYNVWYGSGNHFVKGTTKDLPVYDIRFTNGSFAFRFDQIRYSAVCLKENEHRVGRPSVIYEDNIYKMWYCYGTEGEFGIGYATSAEPYAFSRMDDQIQFTDDASLRAYPAVFDYKGKRWMAYNTSYGIAMEGRESITFATLEE